MKDARIYEIKLSADTAQQIEVAQTQFMSAVFNLAKESGIPGLEITFPNADVILDEYYTKQPERST